MEKKGGRIERVKGYKSRDDEGEGTKVLHARNISIVLMFWGFSIMVVPGDFKTLFRTDLSYLT